ncbi:MAG: amidohydrolase [Fretibacterium sp.]|nr:amidohydrolase [Fretibacterium sp.]
MNTQMVEWRRHLHAHPELGYETPQTMAFIAERLKELGATDIRTGVGKGGVTAIIQGSGPTPVLGIRADIDALPVKEETGLSFASTVEGRMHACGHDAHTAMLLGAAKLLIQNKDKLKGSVKLIFQPAEEVTSGAMTMIADGVLENPKVDGVVGLHTGSLWGGFKSGEIGYCETPMMAACDFFYIHIKGKGGHGATPHLTVDPISIGCQIYSGLQTIVSRETSPLAPAVLTVGSFQGGATPNIIPPDCTLKGTLRALTPELRRELQDRITHIAQETARLMRGSATVTFDYGPPPLIPDKAMVRKLVRAAGDVVGPERVRAIPEPTMGAEDMACFLEKVPGVFFFHPSTFGDDRDYPHHHPKFSINEDVLWTGAGSLAQFALTWQD